MDKRIEKIAKRRDLAPQFVETIIAGADSGFLKGWRNWVDSYRISVLKNLETKSDPMDIYRLQGMLTAYRKLDNRIDEVLEDYKREKKKDDK